MKEYKRDERGRFAPKEAKEAKEASELLGVPHKATFTLPEHQIADVEKHPWSQSGRMRFEEVDLRQLAEDGGFYKEGVLDSMRRDIWGDDARKYRYDFSKEGGPREWPYAYKDKATGKWQMGDGRHRMASLLNMGYTHAMLPVLRD